MAREKIYMYVALIYYLIPPTGYSLRIEIIPDFEKKICGCWSMEMTREMQLEAERERLVVEMMREIY